MRHFEGTKYLNKVFCNVHVCVRVRCALFRLEFRAVIWNGFAGTIYDRLNTNYTMSISTKWLRNTNAFWSLPLDHRHCLAKQEIPEIGQPQLCPPFPEMLNGPAHLLSPFSYPALRATLDRKNIRLRACPCSACQSKQIKAFLQPGTAALAWIACARLRGCGL